MSKTCFDKSYNKPSSDGTKCYHKDTNMSNPPQEQCNKDYIKIGSKCYYQPSINNNTYKVCDESVSKISSDYYCISNNNNIKQPRCDKLTQNILKSNKNDKIIACSNKECNPDLYPINVKYTDGVRNESNCNTLYKDKDYNICNTYLDEFGNKAEFKSNVENGIRMGFCVFVNNKKSLNYQLAA